MSHQPLSHQPLSNASADALMAMHAEAMSRLADRPTPLLQNSFDFVDAVFWTNAFDKVLRELDLGLDVAGKIHFAWCDSMELRLKIASAR